MGVLRRGDGMHSLTPFLNGVNALLLPGGSYSYAVAEPGPPAFCGTFIFEPPVYASNFCDCAEFKLTPIKPVC